jgi:spermidine synthase
MWKPSGVMVHSTRDEEGPVQVVDAYGVRSLHFGTAPKQSSMSLADPDRLELAYVRAMLAGLLFAPEPRRVLLLGLGGGSLAKFLLRHFPDCRLDAVESRPAVAAVARRFFGLPEDPRLTLHFEDGSEFLCRQAESHSHVYDHLFIDIYDHQGLSASAGRHDFFAAAARLLNPGGVLAINLWGSHPESLRHAMKMLGLYFEGRTLRLQVIGRGNLIGFGLGAGLPRPDREVLKQRARQLEQRLDVEFPRLLHLLSPLR